MRERVSISAYNYSYSPCIKKSDQIFVFFSVYFFNNYYLITKYFLLLYLSQIDTTPTDVERW